jgi:hypothetical protein
VETALASGSYSCNALPLVGSIPTYPTNYGFESRSQEGTVRHSPVVNVPTQPPIQSLRNRGLCCDGPSLLLSYGGVIKLCELQVISTLNFQNLSIHQ